MKYVNVIPKHTFAILNRLEIKRLFKARRDVDRQYRLNAVDSTDWIDRRISITVK